MRINAHYQRRICTINPKRCLWGFTLSGDRHRNPNELELEVASYTNKSDNTFVGVGFGEIITDEQLAGWDVAHLVKIGALVPVTETKKADK